MRRTITAPSFSVWVALLLGLGLLLASRPGRAQSLPASEGLVADSTELRVLRQFYTTTHGAQWASGSSWLQGTSLTDAATWPGVGVSNGDVVSLSYRYTNMQGGQLPTHLGDLRALQFLDVSFTHLTGPLPTSLGQCTQLYWLNAQYNEHTGSIPAELGNTSLHNVYLDRNHFSGSLPTTLSRLSLTEFWVDANELTGPFPTWLVQQTGLQNLGLSSNYFSGPVPQGLGQLTGLYGLYLYNNAFTGPLPADLGQLTNLVLLYVGDNGWEGPIPAELGNLHNLVHLGLYNAHFTGSVPASFAQLTQLQYLYLQNNNLSGPLPATLGQLTSLVQLYAGDNNWQGTIPTELGQLTNLQQLALYNAHFSGAVPASIAQLPHLQYIYLYNNNLTDLPAWAGTGHHLGKLFVEDNRLSFAALEGNFTGLGAAVADTYAYDPQRDSVRVDSVHAHVGDAVQLAGQIPGAHNVYQWQYQAVGGQWADLAGQTQPSLSLASVTTAQAGAYRTQVTNSWVVNLTLHSPTYYLLVDPAVPDVLPPVANAPVDGCTPTLVNAAPTAQRPALGGDSINFVRTFVPRVALTDTAAVRLGAKEQVQVQTQYLDGLGRPVQTVQHQASPLGNDLVQPVAYDGLGRQPRQYEPYSAAPSGSPGHYRPNALREQYDFYRQDPATTPAGPGNLSDGVAPTGVAYAETQFEASPLNRVLAQGTPGEAWQLTPTGGHAVRRLERPNTAADAVPQLIPGYDPTPRTLTYAGDYAAGELWLNETSDEHGNRTQEYKDKLGQVVAKRVENPAAGATGLDGWLSTYYAYDDFSHLRAVVPPKAARLLRQTSPAWTINPEVEALLFRYRYDGRGRQIAKQVPGQDSETWVVYDLLDRPVLSQDASQRQRKEWSWTKYDALGRVVLAGLVRQTDTAGLDELQTRAAADTLTAHQYEQRTADKATFPQYYTTSQAYPRLGQVGFGAGQVLSATYYDDYNFDNDAAGQADASYDTRTDGEFAGGTAPVADVLRTQGMVTRTATRVLGVAENDPNQAAWLTTTTFYDERARPIQVQSTNARKGLDLVTTQLDFPGRVLRSVAFHQGLKHDPVLVRENFTYDHTGRVLTTSQQVDTEAQPAAVATQGYNEVGQLLRKTLGSSALMQQVDYRYNARGWLTNLNDADNPTLGDLFNLTLSYDCGFQVSQYNGNIAGQKWRGRDGVERAYGYLYDPGNRLLQGDFVARSAVGTWTGETQHYALGQMSYDENGNILALQRRGLLQAATSRQPARYGAVDDLRYAYLGNRLQAVDDQVASNQLARPANYHGAPTSLAGDFQEQGVKLGQEYLYDANGNLTQDKNKGITGILYNHLNLPRQIHFGQVGDSVVFRYTASGQKVAKLVYQTGKPMPQRTDYLGPYQYEQDSLKFFPHAEGRVLRFVSYNAAHQSTVSYQREFTVKDHLGNLRLAYRLGQRRTLMATLEQDSVTRKRETQQFDSLSVSPPIAVAAPMARSGQWAAKLNAGSTTPQPLGTLTQLGVQKGDTVMVTAYGYYPQAQQSGLLFSLASFITNLLHPASPPPTGLEAGKRQDLPLLQVGLAAGLASLPQLSGGVPQAYLRLLVFDKDSVLLKDQCQVVQLTQVANGGYEQLHLQAILPQDGYVTAYVGSQSNVDVYFDDVSVEHRPGLQVQENQYEPWGLNLAGVNYSSPGIIELNHYQFNGTENQADLGLNWNHHNTRYFDYQVGRWHSIDQLSEKFSGESAYNFANDNPTSKYDSDGKAGIASIDHKNHTITVTSHMIFYGPSANASLAKSTAADVQNAWNSANGTVNIGPGIYKVKFVVTGEYNPNVTEKEIKENSSYKNNYIGIAKENAEGISYMDPSVPFTGSNSGSFLLKNIAKDGSTTEGHEMGHGYGENHSGGKDVDLRGEGVPDIMAPRGTKVDIMYQYNLGSYSGLQGGTVNTEYRKVNQDNIDNLGLDKVQYDKNGNANLGQLTNKYHPNGY